MCAIHSPVGKNGVKLSSSSNGSSHGRPAAAKNGAPARSNGVEPGATAPVVPERRVVKILQLIQSESLWRIQDLARQFNLSNSHLEHLFKQQTGVSLGHLLTERRMQRAAHLLIHTNLRIKEVAQAVGYEHTSSFVRAFQRHFTRAPHLYRLEPAKPPQEALTRILAG